MATITISITGTALMPNSQKSYTVSDADFQNVLNWAASAFANQIPQSSTNQQIALAWISTLLVQRTISEVQTFMRVTPPPITIG